MADNGERRMLFDLQGKRKNVVRVVYATLALLMGGSLFIAVGPFNLAELVGNSNTVDAGKVQIEQAERIESRLAKDPENQQLLLSLTRTRISAGNSMTKENTTTGLVEVTPEAREQYVFAEAAWDQYLEVAGDEVNPNAAQLVAGMFFSLAEGGGTLAQIEAGLQGAAEAQQIVADSRPSVGSLSSLAMYQYFAGDFAAGDKSTQEAVKLAGSKAAGKEVEKQTNEIRERAKEWDKQRTRLVKLQRERGKEELQNPLGGLSGGGFAP